MESTESSVGKHILVTGATGYIGHKLAMRLAEAGAQVHALVRSPKAKDVLNHPNIILFNGDIEDLESVRKAVEGCQQVYHVAALARLVHKDPMLFYRVNVDGTENVLKASLDAGVEKIVSTSTTGVIGPCLNKPMRESDPRIIGYDNHYESSKELAENLVLEFHKKGLTGVVVSPSRVYGPGIVTFSNGVNRFVIGYLKKGFAVVPHCDPVEGNYVYIDDVVNGHILAMEKGEGGERYILGGENVSFGNFTKAIRESAKKGMFVKVPTAVIKIAAVSSQFKAAILRQTPELTPRMVDRLFLHCSFSSDKAVEELGYTITPFNEGISKTIAHLRNGTHA